MAHGLTVTQAPRFHQALHGYADGHRQLALSRQLEPSDQRSLLALSDISGPGARLGTEGYLTGYPLTESGVFALGRTWPAAEMSRPGCVWTHTFLIDFADLDLLPSLTGLLGMFRRPASARAAAEYDSLMTFAPSAPVPFSPIAEDWLRLVLFGLYAKPRSRIAASRFGAEVEDVVLALWSQQWPGLRRNFRFCTFAVRDRSGISGSFDLQVRPASDRSVRSRFPDVVDAELLRPNTAQWLDDAVYDLQHPERSNLRELFHRLDAGTMAGRQIFRPFCSLHRALATCRDQPEAVSDAITVLQAYLPSHFSHTARRIVAEAALEHLDFLDESSFAFLWKSLELLHAETVVSAAGRLGRSAWRREPGLLVPFLDSADKFVAILDRTLAELSISDLVVGLVKAPCLRSAALSRRPELVTQPGFWENLDAVDDAFRAARGAGVGAAVSALMDAGRDNLATRAVQEFGSQPILHSLAAAWHRLGDRVNVWLDASTGGPAAVAEFLGTERGIPMSMLSGLARCLSPDAVPNDYGEDPWLVAYRHATGQMYEPAASYLAAYLLSRALSRRSRCAAELAQISFEGVHAALAGNRLLYDAWRLLEWRLPSSSTWFDWDHCYRLRAGVVALFIDDGLAPRLFATLCEDDRLFSLLLERAARNKRGRRYLRLVRESMENTYDERLASRLSIVNRFVNSCK